MTAAQDDTQADELDEAIGAWLEANAAEKKWTEQKAAAAAVLLRLLPLGTNVGGVMVVPGPRRFDPELARRMLTDDQYAAICEAKASVTLAKRHLPGGLVEQLYGPPGGPYVKATW